MGLPPILEWLHWFQWELCHKHCCNVDSGFTLTFGVNGSLLHLFWFLGCDHTTRFRHQRQRLEAYGFETSFLVLRCVHTKRNYQQAQQWGTLGSRSEASTQYHTMHSFQVVVPVLSNVNDKQDSLFQCNHGNVVQVVKVQDTTPVQGLRGKRLRNVVDDRVTQMLFLKKKKKEHRYPQIETYFNLHLNTWISSSIFWK